MRSAWKYELEKNTKIVIIEAGAIINNAFEGMLMSILYSTHQVYTWTGVDKILPWEYITHISYYREYIGGPIMSAISDMLKSKYDCNPDYKRVQIWLQSFLLGNKYDCNFENRVEYF